MKSRTIKVDYLEFNYQDRLKQRSNQHLRLPWAIDENERMEHASVVYPRPGARDDYQGHIYLSGRGGFGLYLGRKGTFEDWSDAISLDDRQRIIEDLLEALRKAGLVEAVDTQGDVAGYQVRSYARNLVRFCREQRDPAHQQRQLVRGLRLLRVGWWSAADRSRVELRSGRRRPAALLPLVRCLPARLDDHR